MNEWDSSGIKVCGIGTWGSTQVQCVGEFGSFYVVVLEWKQIQHVQIIDKTKNASQNCEKLRGKEEEDTWSQIVVYSGVHIVKCTYLRPLNRFLDLSSRWQNSTTIFLSWSSMAAILTTISKFYIIPFIKTATSCWESSKG